MSGAAADWRRFLTGRYAAFGTLAVSDAIAVALAGDGLAIPLVTTLGASPALATLIGLFPFVGGILQAFVPAILRRNHGDLRGLTIVIAAIGLMRPLLYIAVVVLIWAGLLSAIGGILLIAIGFGVGATAQALAGANVQTWFGRILPERERRFVAPRALAIQFGLGVAETSQFVLATPDQVGAGQRARLRQHRAQGAHGLCIGDVVGLACGGGSLGRVLSRRGAT